MAWPGVFILLRKKKKTPFSLEKIKNKTLTKVCPKKMENQVKQGCFKKNSMCSKIPKDVWMLLLLGMNDARTTRRFSHMSRGFKELVNEASQCFMRMALTKRKEKEPELAQKYLYAALYCGNSDAMVHIGYAYLFGHGEWRIQQMNYRTALTWFNRAANNHNIKARALLAKCMGYRTDEAFEKRLAAVGPEKGDALFVSGCLHYYQFCGTGYEFHGRGDETEEKACELLEQSAEIYDNEFAQLELMDIYEKYLDFKQSFYWASKAAKHGSARAVCKQIFFKVRHGKILDRVFFKIKNT
jgi:TPR repeat protein